MSKSKQKVAKEKLSKEEKQKQKKEKKAAEKKRIAAMSNNQRKKYYLKNAVIIVAIAFAVLLVLCLVLGIVEQFLKDNKTPEQKTLSDTRTVNIYAEHPTYPAFEIDYDKDVYQNEEFLQKELGMIYIERESGLTYPLDKPASTEHEGHRFFAEYFEMLREGNYEIYPSFFSEDYVPSTSYEQNINRVFPPQMVYDIVIEELARTGSTSDGKPCTRGYYKVSYRIFKNDLMFRSDIGYNSDIEKDVALPLVFELVTYNSGKANEVTYIHNMYTELSIENK